MARSGWVRPESPGRLSVHVSLGVLTRVFPPDVVDRVIERSGAGEQRTRLLPSRLMVYYVMALALFAQGSYEEAMRSLLRNVHFRAIPVNPRGWPDLPVAGRFRLEKPERPNERIDHVFD